MVSIRELEEKDLTHVAELLSRGFSNTTENTWLNRFKMWWEINPAFNINISRGWVLENDNGLVGFIGNIPVKFSIRGDIKIATAATDWYVEPKFRGIFSIRLLNEFLRQKYSSLFLFKTESEKMVKILAKYRFLEYQLPPFQLEYIYIVNRMNLDLITKKILFIDNNNKINLIPLIRRLGAMAYTYLSQKQLIFNGGEFNTSICNICDDSFTQLWEPLLNSCDVSLLRDKNTLNWLYFSSGGPYKRVVIQSKRSSDDSLAGYMVFDIIFKKASGAAIMQLRDICIPGNNPEIFKSLLSFAVEIGKKNKVALLVLWANNQEINILLQSICRFHWAPNYRTFIRFSGIPSNPCNVCLSLIDPPHGTD